VEVTTNPKNTKCLTAGNYTFEEVSDFKYRDTLITSNNNLSTEIHLRWQVANRCYLGRIKQPRSHYTRINTELKLYKTKIRPFLLYGCETWAINKSDDNKVRIFERKVLRSICDPINVNGDWRTRCNHELYQSPNFSNHQIVISITVSSPDRSYIEYTRMTAPVCQYMITLVVSLPIRNVSVREHRALNN
jgi:hypothetical protein